jgi:hypothetical protein
MQLDAVEGRQYQAVYQDLRIPMKALLPGNYLNDPTFLLVLKSHFLSRW